MANKCNSCGATVPDSATVCPYCGNAITPLTSHSSNADDVPSTGLNVLSFLFAPIVGIILYFVHRDESPIKAKACLKWTLIGLGVWVAFSLLSSLIVGWIYLTI